jgi:hypothetical protein
MYISRYHCQQGLWDVCKLRCFSCSGNLLSSCRSFLVSFIHILDCWSYIVRFLPENANSIIFSLPFFKLWRRMWLSGMTLLIRSEEPFTLNIISEKCLVYLTCITAQCSQCRYQRTKSITGGIAGVGGGRVRRTIEEHNPQATGTDH